MEKETQGRVGGVRFDRLGWGWGFGFGVVYGKHQHFPVFFWKTLWDRDVTLECSHGMIFLSKLLWISSLGKRSVGRTLIPLWVFFFRVCPFSHPQGWAVGKKFMLAQGSTSLTQPNNAFLSFLCLCRDTPSLYMIQCKQSFSTPDWHWGSVSPLGPQTGVVGLLFDVACVYLGPQTSWCHSGSDLERVFLPGEGVKRSVLVDIS